ncbi:MAG: hypothetical protein R3B90_12745 [Planctomycetaceae bacterium]
MLRSQPPQLDQAGFQLFYLSVDPREVGGLGRFLIVAAQPVEHRNHDREPAALWGLSDGDVTWWCYDALARTPGIDRLWLDALALTSGLHPEDRDELWPLFDEACRNAPHWLVQYGSDIAERLTHAALMSHGVGVEPDGFCYAGSLRRKIDCNAVYKLLDEGLWWSLLAGKRLAIVSGHANALAVRLRDESFVRANGGYDVTWTIATTVTCPQLNQPKHMHWSWLDGE